MVEQNPMIDWSKHELLIEDSEEKKIWRLKRPGTCVFQVNFINTEGRLLVTGDYRDWLFCREFHPSPDGHVSFGYWMEKLRTSMGHMDWDLDWDAIQKEIDEFPSRYTDDDLTVPEEVTDWLRDLETHMDDKLDYEYCAFREKPSQIDYEDVPYCRKVPIQLDIVFDAFNEICRRLKEREGK